jgi:hypothetical protein
LGGGEIAVDSMFGGGGELGILRDDAELAVVEQALAGEVLRADEYGPAIDEDQIGVDLQRGVCGVSTHLGATQAQRGGSLSWRSHARERLIQSDQP